MAVVTAARQIPAECESRTIYPLLAKPVTRSQMMLGKFLGCWLACGLALLVFYAFFAVISASREHELPVISYLQVFWMHWVMLGIVIAMTLLGSVVLAAPSSTNTIVLIMVVGILLLGQHLNKVSGRLDPFSGTVLAAVYYAIPHLEFYDLRSVVIHNWEARDGLMILLATLYGATYSAAFLVAACWVFQRKRLNP
jgi:ABC-type transport system involved in multi-copper enzyme maturation permease subunit